MAPFHRGFFRRAQEMAQAAQSQTERLQQEIADAERRKADAEAALELARSAIYRFDHFDPLFGGDFQCPDCWVSRGVHASMIPIPSDTGADWFRCKTCGLELSTD